MEDASPYEVLLYRRIRADSRESLRARSCWRFSSLCSGAKEEDMGLDTIELGLAGVMPSFWRSIEERSPSNIIGDEAAELKGSVTGRSC